MRSRIVSNCATDNCRGLCATSRSTRSSSSSTLARAVSPCSSAVWRYKRFSSTSLRRGVARPEMFTCLGPIRFRARRWRIRSAPFRSGRDVRRRPASTRSRTLAASAIGFGGPTCRPGQERDNHQRCDGAEGCETSWLKPRVARTDQTMLRAASRLVCSRQTATSDAFFRQARRDLLPHALAVVGAGIGHRHGIQRREHRVDAIKLARHSGQSFKCVAMASRWRASLSSPQLACELAAVIRDQFFLIRMIHIPFPSLVPGRAAPQRARAPGAISAPSEKPCSSRRSNSISALRRFPRCQIRPNGASQKRCAPRESVVQRAAHVRRRAVRFARGAPGSALHRGRSSSRQLRSPSSLPRAARVRDCASSLLRWRMRSIA